MAIRWIYVTRLNNVLADVPDNPAETDVKDLSDDKTLSRTS